MAIKRNLALLAESAITTGPKSQFHTMQVVLNCNLSMMHDRMMELCEKSLGIDPAKIPNGNCVLFVNVATTYIKMLVGNESRFPIVAAYRLPPRQKFSMHAVASIAAAFRSNAKVDATLKLRQAMAEHFKERKAV